MAAENTVVFKSVAYSGGIILGGWGLVEIFLRVDPFYALFLRNLDGVGWFVAGAACALIAWHTHPGPLKLDGNPDRRRNLGLATGTLGLIVLAGWLIAPRLLEGPLMTGTVLGGALVDQGRIFLAGALLATAVACAVCPAVPQWRQGESEPSRVWPHWLDIPVVVGMVVVSAMLLLVSTGRVRSLTEGDVAQEELRRGGLEFSMPSLQEALYLISPRSVELFRKANVDDGDILDALGAPTSFTGEAPLITSILARIDGDDDLTCGRQVLNSVPNGGASAAVRDACGRIDAFIRLFRVEPDPNPWRQLLEADTTNRAMCFTTRPGVVDEARFRSRPGEGSRAERSLCERLKDPIPLRNPDGAPPRPLLSYAFSGGHANVARCVLELCRHPGSGIEIRPLTDDPSVDTAFGPSQLHIRFALDPYLALEHGRSAPDSPWSPDEVEAFSEILPTVDVRPSGVGLGGDSLAMTDAALTGQPDLHGIHVNHAGGRCRTQTVGLVETGTGQLHDGVPATSFMFDMAGEGTALQGLLIDYGEALPYLRFVHERIQEQGGQRMTVLDPVQRPGRGRGLEFLSGTDTSFLLNVAGGVVKEPPVVETLALRVGSPVAVQVGAALGWQTVNVEMPETGRIVLTGRAESDLCLEMRDGPGPEGNIVADAFVQHARTFSVDTDVLRAGIYSLRVTALHDDPEELPTTIRGAVRPTLFCTHEAPEDAGGDQVLRSGRTIAPYRVEEAPGNRLYCPFQTDGFAHVAFSATAESDIEVRLVELTARAEASDAVSWIDSSGSGTEGAPVRETATRLAVPKRDYVFEVRPFGDAQLTAEPLEVSLVQGPSVTQDMLRAAVARAVAVDSAKAAVLIPRAPPVEAVRISEDGLYTVEAAGNTQAFRYDPSADSLLSETDGGGTLDFAAGDILVALATGPAGGRVTIDPIASRQIALGIAQRFEALESGNSRIHVVEPQSNGPIDIILTPLDGEDLDLAVRSPDGGELGSSGTGGAAVDSVTVDARAGEPLIVEVSALGTSRYSLHAVDVREGFEDLPELVAGETAARSALSEGERVRFRLVADRPGALTITLRPTQGDLDLAVLSLAGDDLGTSMNVDTEPDSVTVTTVAGQILIVEVSALETSGFSLGAEYR